jgi:ABC-type tungstate transport system substrate-binding protein
VLEALLSSLDPVDQNTFFVHFCSNKYYARNNKSFGQDVDAFGNAPLLMIACAALVILGALSIFSFKNRKRQIMLNNISIFINALLIGVLFYWLLNLSGGISFPEKGIELIFPILAITCLLIANVFIRKDEKLVKSVDRLR